jgi:hypothetical protein
MKILIILMCFSNTNNIFFYPRYDETQVPNQYLVGVSENGFTTDELAYHWIHHFNKHTAHRTRGAYRLLLLDNHGSHLTRQFLDYCSNNKIFLFTFPPHLTHRLQPLDLIPFQQYKLNHGQAVNRAARQEAKTFDKSDFMTTIQSIREKSFQPHIIKAGWRKAGIRPFKSTEILKKIRGRSSSPILRVTEGALADSPSPNRDREIFDSCYRPTA